MHPVTQLLTRVISVHHVLVQHVDKFQSCRYIYICFAVVDELYHRRFRSHKACTWKNLLLFNYLADFESVWLVKTLYLKLCNYLDLLCEGFMPSSCAFANFALIF